MIFKNKEGDRFEVIYSQDKLTTTINILRDKDTGVCYLYMGVNTYGGRLTPLLGRDGRPVIR